MRLNDHKEQFSLAYIHAVAAQAGFLFDVPSKDLASVDATVRSDEGLEPHLHLQAKSTARLDRSETGIRFRLPAKNYRDLAALTQTPKFLIVAHLPSDTPGDWATWVPEEFCLRVEAYWGSLRGMSPTGSGDRVPVELVTRFGPASLERLLGRIEQEGVHATPD